MGVIERIIAIMASTTLIASPPGLKAEALLGVASE